jgi:hypothetical protein
VLVGVEAMELQHELRIPEEHLEVVAAVARTEPDHLLVPPARRGDIADLEHRAELHLRHVRRGAGRGTIMAG